MRPAKRSAAQASTLLGRAVLELVGDDAKVLVGDGQGAHAGDTIRENLMTSIKGRDTPETGDDSREQPSRLLHARAAASPSRAGASPPGRAAPGDGIVRVSRTSSGRRGKTVTLVTGLPPGDLAPRRRRAQAPVRVGRLGEGRDGRDPGRPPRADRRAPVRPLPRQGGGRLRTGTSRRPPAPGGGRRRARRPAPRGPPTTAPPPGRPRPARPAARSRRGPRCRTSRMPPGPPALELLGHPQAGGEAQRGGRGRRRPGRSPSGARARQGLAVRAHEQRDQGQLAVAEAGQARVQHEVEAVLVVVVVVDHDARVVQHPRRPEQLALGAVHGVEAEPRELVVDAEGELRRRARRGAARSGRCPPG